MCTASALLLKQLGSTPNKEEDIGIRENPSDVESSIFTKTVSDNSSGNNAPRSPKCKLANIWFLGLNERKHGGKPEILGNLIELKKLIAHESVFLEQLLSHSGVLRSLAGKGEYDLGRALGTADTNIVDKSSLNLGANLFDCSASEKNSVLMVDATSCACVRELSWLERNTNVALRKVSWETVVDLSLDAAMRNDGVLLHHLQDLNDTADTRGSFTVADIGFG
ncbi:hypothetical protein HG530_009481 [Fusarium avenaceum]|nr:hypothetical protein HG530_009481 [Fusarium avenaceum]